MPPTPYLEIDKLDCSNVLVDRERIYKVLPHRHEFERLDAIVHLDVENGLMAGYHDVRGDEFWVRGHIPGRPIFPGVMMVETAAQLVSYYVWCAAKMDGFLGFAALDDVKFRGAVEPGHRLILVGKMLELRPPRRCKGSVQGFVDGKMVFESTITGMWL
jgi:3-hydroxyacyl-[acyl-carrier-protein] dehydratase